MKIIYKSLFIASLIAISTNATGQEVQPCNQVEMTDSWLENLTSKEKNAILQEQSELEFFTQEFVNNAEHQTKDDALFIVPVVFHIIHTNGPENISDEQILNCVEIMNRDFRMLNTDVNNVHPDFLGIAADAQIEFRLAKKDPSGNCTKGITRTFSESTFGGTEEDRLSAVQSQHGNWPGTRYLNVFVAAEIGGAAGYTYRPSSWRTGMNNGIHVLHTYVGGIGTSSTQRSRTMTHEAGHWFNLPHTWGGTNNPGLATNCDDDDGVADTPLTIGWTSCNTNGESCGSLDNVENYMEYSYCSKMFTIGQKNRMQAALNSTTGGRSSVVSSSNLTFTGVSQEEAFCKADFRANMTEICAGESVSFMDDSFFGPTTWNWTFEGGSPSNSIEQNPTITYTEPGLYSVSLTSGDGTDSDVVTKNAFIRVLPSTTVLPFMESFEEYTTLSDAQGKWVSRNPGENNTWEVYDGAGHTGNKSVRIMNIGQPSGGIDELISGSFDLSDLSSSEDITLTFRYSFKQRSSSNDDRLRILASADCGETWATRRQILSSTLSLGTQATSWTPASQDDWVTNHVTNITSSYFVNGMRFKFEWQHGGGNNIYLDDINLYKGSSDPLSILEQTAFGSDAQLFPNPTIGELTVRVSIPDAIDFDVNIVDLSGKQLQSFRIQGKQGTNDIMLLVDKLAQGMYMVELVSASGKTVKQFVKN